MNKNLHRRKFFLIAAIFLFGLIILGFYRCQLIKKEKKEIRQEIEQILKEHPEILGEE